VIPLNPELSRALSAFDMRHNFVVSYRYRLPLGNVFRHQNLWTEGWSVSITCQKGVESRILAQIDLATGSMTQPHQAHACQHRNLRLAPRDDIQTIARPDLPQDTMDMVLDGLLAQVQAVSNLLIGKAEPNQTYQLLFSPA